MSGNFDAALTFTFREEGGFSNDPDDHGGATKFGITQATLASWRGKTVLTQDVKDLTRDEAGMIYRKRYWDTISGDLLPSGLDLMVFDFGVNAGWKTSVLLLQKLVGTNLDGLIGPTTLRAVHAHDTKMLVAALQVPQVNHYNLIVAADPDQGKFLDDWLGRTTRRTQAALRLVAVGG